MLPEWLQPPMPTHQGTKRLVKGVWDDAPVLVYHKRGGRTLVPGQTGRLRAALDLVREYPGLTTAELNRYWTLPNTLNSALCELAAFKKVRREKTDQKRYRYWIA